MKTQNKADGVKITSHKEKCLNIFPLRRLFFLLFIGIVFLIIFFITDAFATECNNLIEPNGYPCSITSYVGTCNVFNYTVYDSTNTIVKSGNLNFVRSGNESIILFYGEMFGKGNYNTSSPFYTIDLTDTEVYNSSNNLSTGKLYGVSHTNLTGILTAEYSGIYSVYAGFVVVPVSTGGQYGMKVYVNEVGQNQCYDYRELSTSPSAMRTNCLVSLNKGDNVSVRFDDHATPVRDLHLYIANVNIQRVGSFNSSAGYYSFDFNTSVSGSYLVKYCDGSSRVLNVGYASGYLSYTLLIICGVLVAFFFILGLIVEEELFAALAGMILFIYSLYMIQNAFATIPLWFNNAIAIILLCIGCYLMLVPYIYKITGGWK